MEEYVLSQQAFDRLWARVRGEAPPQPARRDDLAVLRVFLEETGQSLLLERRLSGLTGMPRLCRDTHSRLIRLETVYYLLTAERWRLPSACPLREGALPALRRDCLSSLARAEDYAAERDRAAEPLLASLYDSLAGEERSHADSLERIIGRLLGGEKK